LNINEILFEFSNRGRTAIFKSLFNNYKRHSDLENEMGLIGSEISRHLKRLRQKKLVIKTSENKYTVSNVGKILYRVLNMLEVTMEYDDFFNTHDIHSIPLYLVMQLGDLKSVELSDKTMQNIELWSDLVKNSEKFIYAISDQFQISLLPIVEKKFKNKKIEIRALVDKSLLKSYNIPEEWAEKFENAKVFYKNINAYENVKILSKIPLSLVVTDKGAILFLSKKEKIDYEQCLIGNHPNFIEWCIELFEKYWKNGKMLKPFIRKETKALS
jgi:predicted transcriptional regulator